jgi:radical SAM superfamily enzyme with C-terminal helix-hairpin-helix motif
MCSLRFGRRADALTHLQSTHRTVPRHNCPHCARTFTATRNLSRHVNRFHS